MEILDKGRARLRCELRQAYEDWLLASEVIAGNPRPSQPMPDTSGCCDAVKVKWLDYLDAKQKLIVAYSELPAAA